MYNPYDPFTVANTLKDIKDPNQIKQFANSVKDRPNGAILAALALNELTSRTQQAQPQMPEGTVIDKALGEAAQQAYAGTNQVETVTHDNSNPQLKALAAQKKAGLAGGGAVLPENVGIGALPERSMVNMADGGIIGFAGGGETPEDIRRIIIEAARRNGIPEDLALRMAGVESSNKAGIVNPRSGATGLFQFLPSTWADMGGDPTKITDPYTNADFGARYIRQNTDKLRKQLGRDPSYAEVYGAHHFGPGVVPMLTADPNLPIDKGLALFESEPRVRDILAKNPHLQDKTVGQVMEYLGAKTAPNKTVMTQDALAEAAARARGVPSVTQSAPVQFGAQSPTELARAKAAATAAKVSREKEAKTPNQILDYSSLEQAPAEMDIPFDMNRELENGVPVEPPPPRPSVADTIRGLYNNPYDAEMKAALDAKRALISDYKTLFDKSYADEQARMARSEAKNADARRLNEAAAWAKAAQAAMTGRQTGAQAFVNALTGGLGAYAAGEEKISTREEEAAAKAAAARLTGMKTGLELSLSGHDVGMEHTKYMRERDEKIASALAKFQLGEMSSSDQTKLFAALDPTGKGDIAAGFKNYAKLMNKKSPIEVTQMHSYIMELQKELAKAEGEVSNRTGAGKARIDALRAQIQTLQKDLADIGGAALLGSTNASAAPNRNVVQWSDFTKG